MRLIPTSNTAVQFLGVVGTVVGYLSYLLCLGYWTRAFGNEILIFSMGTVFYFLGIELGGYLYSQNRDRDPHLLLFPVLGLCLSLGFWIPVLKVAIKLIGEYSFIPIALCFITGALSGTNLPLVLTKSRKTSQKPNIALVVFSHYLVTTLFIIGLLLCLQQFSFGNVSLVSCFISLVVVAILMWKLDLFHGVALNTFFFCILAPYPTHWLTGILVPSVQYGRAKMINEANIVLAKQTPYQKIILTEEVGGNNEFPQLAEHILYLDGFIQFNSFEEQYYHSCLSDIALSAARFANHTVKSALVVGGGDGLAVRNVLNQPGLESVTVVERDKFFTDLSQSNNNLRIYNRDSLKHPKVTVINEDPFLWVQRNKALFDLIVVDLPAPNSISLARNYSAEFYTSLFSRLHPTGVAILQSGPIFDPLDPQSETLSMVTASIKRTLEAIEVTAHPFYSQYDHQAFLLVSKEPRFSMKQFAQKMGFLESQKTTRFCRYREKWKYPLAKRNTVNALVISDYLRTWFKEAEIAAFDYRGVYSVFLPE